MGKEAFIFSTPAKMSKLHDFLLTCISVKLDLYISELNVFFFVIYF